MQLPKIGDSIKFKNDIEIEGENGFIYQIPAGTPMKVSELDGQESFEVQYEKYGSIAFGAEVGDLEYIDQFDRSGQSDSTVDGGLQWFDVDPEDFTIV